MPIRDGPDLSTEALFLLWAARKTGALEALAASAGTPRDLADQTDLTPAAAETVVTVLDDLNYLEQVGDAYEFTNRALGFLAKRDVRSIGRVPHVLDLIDAYTELPQTLTTGDPPDPPTDWTRNQLGADAAADEVIVRARVTAARREAADADTALVVGIGGGADAMELTARGLDVTGLDSSDVVEAIGPMVASAGIETLAKSLWSHTAQYGLVYGADLCTGATPDEARAIVAAASERLARNDSAESDGILVLIETVRDRIDPDAAGGDTGAAETVALNPAVAADVRGLALGAGGAHGSERYREWANAAGLETSFAAVPGTELTAVVYCHPERTVQED